MTCSWPFRIIKSSYEKLYWKREKDTRSLCFCSSASARSYPCLKVSSNPDCIELIYQVRRFLDIKNLSANLAVNRLIEKNPKKNICTFLRAYRFFFHWFVFPNTRHLQKKCTFCSKTANKGDKVNQSPLFSSSPLLSPPLSISPRLLS